MLYYIGDFLLTTFGKGNNPVGRLLTSNAVLIVLALYVGFSLTRYILPLFFSRLPSDRGREFTLSKEASKGKPTGSGVVFVTVFVVLALLFTPLPYDTASDEKVFLLGMEISARVFRYLTQISVLFLTWIMMLTGYLDDRSEKGWGEYIKAFLDFVVCTVTAFLLAYYLSKVSEDGTLSFWLPFVKEPVKISLWLYIIITIIMLWVSINTTNCTDGVDGLSSSLVLLALFTLGLIFYVILGHTDMASYLLVPHFTGGASWAIIIFTFSGVVMGYLWHNAFPSSVLMGDAGSRALGFFIGVCVMISGNPLLFLVTSSIIFINGGMGLLKVALKRYLHINIFETVRFPLHDHMRKNHGWSPTQVLIKFLMIQILITIGMLGVFFKIR